MSTKEVESGYVFTAMEHNILRDALKFKMEGIKRLRNSTIPGSKIHDAHTEQFNDTVSVLNRLGG